ncbi:hypothetical protein ACQPTN_37575 [Bradyrhizobium sp. 13971]
MAAALSSISTPQRMIHWYDSVHAAAKFRRGVRMIGLACVDAMAVFLLPEFLNGIAGRHAGDGVVGDP